MKIETRFVIGEQVYYVCEFEDYIEIHIDTITDISISKDKICYFTKNCYDSINESDLYKLDEFYKIRYKLIKSEIERNIEDVEN